MKLSKQNASQFAIFLEHKNGTEIDLFYKSKVVQNEILKKLFGFFSYSKKHANFERFSRHFCQAQTQKLLGVD